MVVGLQHGVDEAIDDIEVKVGEVVDLGVIELDVIE